MITMFQEISVGAVVFRKNNEIKYLILHYPHGHWDFPKGNVEKGESEEETLRREIKEETGIDDIKIIGGFRKTIEYFYRREGKTIHKQVIFYLAETTTNRVRLSYEHIGFKWVPYEEALKIITFENSKNILKEAHKHLKSSLLGFET